MNILISKYRLKGVMVLSGGSGLLALLLKKSLVVLAIALLLEENGVSLGRGVAHGH